MAYKNILKLMVLSLLLGIIFFGCAHQIRLEVQRPPKLNTVGITRIAIMPFEGTSGRANEMAQYATQVATQKIQGNTSLTLVDPILVQGRLSRNESIEDLVDAVFRGQVTKAEESRSTRQGSYRDRDGNVITYTDYITSVEVELNYYLTRARDGSLIGPERKSGRDSLSDRSTYPASDRLLRGLVDRHLNLLHQDIAPHTVIQYRSIAKDKSKDKELKTEMKDTLNQVKAGSYKIALDAYLSIYDRYNSLAAAENAAILYEALGETETAANFMRQVLNATGNPKIREVLARLDKILQDQDILAADYAEAKTLTERVADFASNEIQKIVPAGARIWIYNSSPDEVLAKAVCDNIEADLIRKGISLVDRQNNDLIEAEQRFQASGAVSDDDFVSIGNASGASVLVNISVTGTGAARRLQLRVLDIETRTPLLQSDTSSNWDI